MFRMLCEIIVFIVEVDWFIKREVIFEWLLWIDDDDNERGLLDICECLLIVLLDVILIFFGDELCSGIVKLLILLLILLKLYLLLIFEFRFVDIDEFFFLLIFWLCFWEIKGLEWRCFFWVVLWFFLLLFFVWFCFLFLFEGLEFFLLEVVLLVVCCCLFFFIYGLLGCMG